MPFCIGIFALNVQAQPAADEAAIKAVGVALSDENSTPETCLSKARKAMQDNASRPAATQLTMYGYIARFQHFRMKDTDGALATLEEALTKFPQDQRRFDLLAMKASIANDSREYDKAESMLKAAWPQILQGDLKHLVAAAPTYVKALQQQGRESEAEGLLRSLFELKLRRIGDGGNGWIFEQQAKLLTSQGKEAQALSWAKLYWNVCPFNDVAISQATQLLLKTWAVNDGDGSIGKAFLAAQTDPKLTNPLSKVPVPEWSADLLAQQYAKAGTSPAIGWNAGTPATAVSERITILILQGQYRRAMLQARQLMLDTPQAPDGVREACRVFKAFDGSLVRANALVEWTRTKQGENPVTAFLREHPEEDSASAPQTKTAAAPRE